MDWMSNSFVPSKKHGLTGQNSICIPVGIPQSQIPHHIYGLQTTEGDHLLRPLSIIEICNFNQAEHWVQLRYQTFVQLKSLKYTSGIYRE